MVIAYNNIGGRLPWILIVKSTREPTLVMAIILELYNMYVSRGSSSFAEDHFEYHSSSTGITTHKWYGFVIYFLTVIVNQVTIDVSPPSLELPPKSPSRLSPPRSADPCWARYAPPGTLGYYLRTYTTLIPDYLIKHSVRIAALQLQQARWRECEKGNTAAWAMQ